MSDSKYRPKAPFSHSIGPWSKTRPSYFYVYFIIAYSYFIYTTIYFRHIFSWVIAFLICPNLGYEPLKYKCNNIFRDGQYFSLINYSWPVLYLLYNPILLKIWLILYGWNSPAWQFEARKSLAVIHSDSVWNEHIHWLGLLLIPQDKRESSHEQPDSRSITGSYHTVLP